MNEMQHLIIVQLYVYSGQDSHALKNYYVSVQL